MEWYWALVLMLGGVVALMLIGLPVAFAFLGINVVGALIFLGGEGGLIQLSRNTIDAVTSYSLAPIFMFVLMGEVLFHTGVAFTAIDAVDRLIARIPGRLSLVAIVGGTVFSTLSGSTVANTALLGSTLMPEMRRRGYHPSIAMGPIMATGGIAMLIPPSSLAVLLGSLAGIPIGPLLIAGIIPGVLMAVLFFAYVIGRCALDRSLAPRYEMETLSFRRRWTPFVTYVAPLFLLFVAVVGGMLGGIVTPTESAAVGALGGFIAAACYRKLTRKNFLHTMIESTKITIVILFIIAGSLTFSQILAFSGATNGLLELVSSVAERPLLLLFCMMAILLFLGCFLDQLSMLMITLPFFMPLAEAAHFDVIWYGVLLLVVMEISLTTPPFGLILFCMKGVAPPGTTTRQIYNAVTPFILLELMVLCAVIFLPGLATALPSLISR
jgi:tripartite ATP-independent transporter DctM subunit